MGLAMLSWFHESAKQWVVTSAHRKGRVDNIELSSLPEDIAPPATGWKG